MTTKWLRTLLKDQRGVALPMALMALVIMAALVVAFSVLSASEPTIANNQLRVAQARALAEAGMERALWGLIQGKCEARATCAATAGSIAYPLTGAAAAPYDASSLVSVSTPTGTPMGGFRVTVTQNLANPPLTAADCAAANERCVVAVGWVPTDAGGDTRTKAHQRITAVLMDLGINPLDMPCALCVRGDIQVGGNSTISAREDTSCGNRYGTWSTRVLDGSGNVVSPGNTTIASGAAQVFGSDGNTSSNQASDMAVQQTQASFDANAMTAAQLNALKTIAKAKGTYYQGAVTFNSSNQMQDGIIFVDTVSGNNITDSTPTSDYASVSINGNPGMGPNNSFKGWIIVNGGISISGNVQLSGMVYAVNDISYSGTGTGFISGQLISQNVRDTVATVVDTNTIGNSSITYNCNDARTGGGVLSPNFLLRPGSYKEVADS
jgi:Tfp pilus assembly protein PilX